MRVPLNADAEALYKSAMRQRLTRAGLLKIMRENEERELTKTSNPAAVDTDSDTGYAGGVKCTPLPGRSCREGDEAEGSR